LPPKEALLFLKNSGKFSKGESNFEIVLASQSCVFGKDGMGLMCVDFRIAHVYGLHFVYGFFI